MNEFNRLNEQIEYGLALLARLTEAQEGIANAADALEAMQARVAELEGALREVLDDYEAYEYGEGGYNRPIHDVDILARAKQAFKGDKE